MSLKQMRFQVASKLIRPNSWITQTIRQRIPNCWARNGESTSAKSAVTDVWNDELTVTGGSQMLETRNRGDRHAVIGEVRRGSPSQTTVDHHRQLVLHPLRNMFVLSPCHRTWNISRRAGGQHKHIINQENHKHPSAWALWRRSHRHS